MREHLVHPFLFRLVVSATPKMVSVVLASRMEKVRLDPILLTCDLEKGI